LGNKYKKEVLEPSLSLQSGTLYIGNGVYKTGSGASSSAPELQFFQHAEGRLRFKPVIQNNVITGGSFHYDYFIKDHLGNVRMVLTEEQQQDVYPAATLEGSLNTTTDAAFIEKEYYTIDPNRVAAISEATGITSYQNNNGNPPYNNNPNSNTTANSQKLYKLEATSAGGVFGLGIAVKVMSGDRIDIFGKSYYFDNNTNQQNYPIPVLDILSGLLGSPSGAAVGKGATAVELNNLPVISTAIGDFLTDIDRGGGTTPKAYINWILFDENFRYVDGNFSRVGSANAVRDHGNDATLQNIPVSKNGYLYVYCSNESPVKVFFDNLQVVHTRGALLEETHYYPFGLTMAGISSKALKSHYPENQKKFNGIDHTTDFDLNTYDAFYRQLDPQIGRWWQIDPKTEDMEIWSPYSVNYNNPLLFCDPNGDEPDPDPPFLQNVKRFFGGIFDGITGHEPNKPLSQQPYTLDTGNWKEKAKGTLPVLLEKIEKPIKSSIEEARGTVHEAGEVFNNLTSGDAYKSGNATGKIIKTAAMLLLPWGMEEKTVERALSIKRPNIKTTPPQTTTFVVTEAGEAIIIPKGAQGPTPPNKGSGMMYQGGQGGYGMDKRTTGVRIMDANKNQGPRVNYMNKSGQTVDPATGKTISNNDPRGHLPLKQKP
jgi:RHS repeat-associated protein